MQRQAIADKAYADAARRMGEALAREDRGAAYAAAEALSREHVGHVIFTVLAWRAGSSQVKRVFTNLPDLYPLSGTKPMGDTGWGDIVLKGGRPWTGHGIEDTRWAFPDYRIAESLGCLSHLNVPVRYRGSVLGTINLSTGERSYTDDDVAFVCGLSGFLAAPLLSAF